jgi:ribosomal-protein-alanine N-acetyltransferase
MIAEPAMVHSLLRPLQWGDLDRVMEIELSAYPFPWTRGIFGDCLRVGYDCWGLQVGPVLIGYTVQTGTAGENHLLNLCVEPGSRRQGFGRLLLENAIRIARLQECFSIFLEVRPSNVAGVALYEGRGFSVIGRRRNYYSAAGGKEDALVMRLDLQEQP